MFVATLVHPSSLPTDLVAAASAALTQAGARVGEADWLEPGVAADIPFAEADLVAARAALARFASAADVIVQPAAGRRRKLLIADMDSTMITCECIDELADYAGFKARVAAVTEAAMRGELDFVQALDGRVALLKGLDAAVIDQCRAERVRLMPGARALVQTMRANGAATILVSGGFTAFAEPVGAEIGFEKVVANVLDIADGRLAGTVARPVVDSQTKLATLKAEAAAHGLTTADCLAVGDGANDIPMIEAAGLGIAYHAKPKTQAAAQAAVTLGDLTALLYAQGYRRAEWAAV